MAAEGRLKGKKAFITGASRGIGRSIALEFAAEGADLFLLDLNDEALEEVAREAETRGAKALPRRGDVTDPESVEQAAAAAERELGEIDVLVNCAGIFQSIAFLDYPVEEWRRVLEVNVTGSFLCAQAVLKRMTGRGRGKVINLASVAGRLGGKFRAGYSTSKHAVIGLTRCIAVEFAEHGITANAICPGMVDTEMFASVVAGDAENLGIDNDEAWAGLQKRALQPRLLDPREIARLAVYLASSDADGMTGQALTYSGGMVMQ